MKHRLIRKVLVTMILPLVLGVRVFASATDPAAVTEGLQANDSTVQEEPSKESSKGEEQFNAEEMIMGHILDSHEWHFFSVKRKDGTEWHASISLPVIIYTPGEGLAIFNYHKLLQSQAIKGFSLDSEENIVRTDGKKFYDFSLSKNVAQMLIAAALMLWMFIGVARIYARRGSKKAPRGLQSVVEVIVIFIRDEVAKPMLGERANKYLPYLLTVFFFIWINNLIGLIPGSANVTGNIGVTATLALLTFILMMVGSKKYYWLHMVRPEGVPGWVLPLLVPIEFISNILVKPFALMIRLFANMLAGHLIILSFMSIIFVFAAMNIAAGLGASVFSVAFSIFIYFLELLVAVLQAYIFTILTALFIGETGVTPAHGKNH